MPSNHYDVIVIGVGSMGAAACREASHQYNIPLDILTHEAANIRYPMIHFPHHFQILFEPDAGFVTPEKAIVLYVSDAMQRNADIRGREKVLEWKKENSGITVITNRNIYRAGRLIISAGAWSGKLIPSLPATLKVTKQIVGWMKPKKWNEFSLGNFPCWFLGDDDGNMFYGFPILPAKYFGGPIGFKLALHKHGDEVDPDLPIEFLRLSRFRTNYQK